jgi:hypothetical protein
VEIGVGTLVASVVGVFVVAVGGTLVSASGVPVARHANKKSGTKRTIFDFIFI